TPSQPMLPPEVVAAGFPRTGREIPLRAPISEEQIRSLKVGDVVLVSGRMFTGRDAVHAHLIKHEPPVDMRGSVLYHCGPVVAKDGSGWKITAAGPTTSIREEPYQAEILKRYGVRVVIGKGGMGAKTLAGLQESGAVYVNADRLRALGMRERIRRAGNRRTGRIRSADHERQRGVRPPLVVLTRRMQVARTNSGGARAAGAQANRFADPGDGLLDGWIGRE